MSGHGRDPQDSTDSRHAGASRDHDSADHDSARVPDARDARDRLLDALLEQHLGEADAKRERRYARAFAALDAAPTPARTHALRVARAALVAITVGVLLLLMPVESRASTVLAQVVSRESRERESPAERRYEVAVRLARRPGMPPPPREVELRGNWDMRGDESRLELRVAGGPSLIRAESADGAWEQREGGVARTLDSSELWPRWIEERSGRIAVERMDELLRLVQRSYEIAFARAGDESPAHLRGTMHLVAARRSRVPGPTEIDLWIDTERNVVIEAHLRWHPVPRPERPTRPPSPSGPPADGAAGSAPFPPDSAPFPPEDDDYRAAPGALPPNPPLELRLRRIEPIAFPADHFRMPRG